ncbi:hypothetical protein C0Q70_17496 [Pomacea canaliculata]|uniref:Methyltransferase type 11 domain-containing protein n=1 Tax=Pomacea canaliculata TaxID=400727 RepID=A0A2T7NKL2_POMCA|nr:uncharacterized protein LOC112575143 [Pomacea canaliculata]XP_025112544.1 uncharacterized protein LOC112575143 [Pomacea canaliculata]XP_025112545.1 uncharacterized protein LOC112575143 [Pomacea canaliculata]XP_025112546.1 uncharacterized protein LOC112575143 [Pomacea canaliculata]XP_025112547.1 uncharacterized protein LOC112575143 [Pomacea canaliculata]XP_025112548.1 uncharacterized protein LOC112575143 [Pomacea canaliculata]PVD21696.1 hypothetical protein C0Q70_17496 [Pomacea canaliculata
MMLPKNRAQFLVAAAVLLIVAALYLVTFNRCFLGKEVHSLRYPECTETSPVREQRNSLSRIQNELKRQLGQLECNMAKLQKIENEVASSGGWCQDESDPKKTKVHHFDQRLANILGHFLSGQCVASFGDGLGNYKEYLLTQGLVASYDAYDGAPFCENVTSGAVKFMDLTIPQYGLPVYDWVICLEVAEHVPARYERVLVDNIARHARKGIVLSWGHPGQEGFHHVNNKSPEDVKRLLDEVGFTLNDSSSSLLRQNSTHYWFRENTFVFERKPEVILREEDA